MKSFAILSALAAAGAVSAQSDTTAPPAPNPTGCPSAGETNAAGDYGCNPNRDYPGEACALIGDCYVLRGLGINTDAPTPTPTNCPAAGETNAAGDYGCNPNRDYPDKACALIGDCYILRGLGFRVSTTMKGGNSTTTINPVKPTSTLTTVINGVTTEVPIAPTKTSNGGYATTGANDVVTTVPPNAVPTAGAAQLSTAGGLAAVLFAAVLL